MSAVISISALVDNFPGSLSAHTNGDEAAMVLNLSINYHYQQDELML